MCIRDRNWSARIRQDYFALMATYQELGGEIVTVGSDAHSPEYVGTHILEVYEMLREIGFRYVTAFEAVSHTHLDVYKRQE